jgi:hypothetical protein
LSAKAKDARRQHGGEGGSRSEGRGAEFGGRIYGHWSQVLFHVALDWSAAGAAARNSV